MKSIIIGVLAIVLVLLVASTAPAAYGYLTPVNPGSVAVVGYYPRGMTYAYPAYGYPMAVGRYYSARPIVAAVPVAAQPMITAYPMVNAYPTVESYPIVESYPTVVAEPVLAVPGPVVYPAPVIVRPRIFVPGQPVRNVVRGVLP